MYIGLNIKRKVTCYVQSADVAKILYVEIIDAMSYANLMTVLQLIFGSQYQFSVVYVDGDQSALSSISSIR